MSRMDKVNQQLKREVSLIVQRELNDPRLEFVTITSVDTSPDLRSTKVYFSVLGDTAGVDKALAALQGASGMVRKLIGKRMSLRYIPEVNFYYDSTIEASARMDYLFKEISDEHQKNQTDH